MKRLLSMAAMLIAELAGFSPLTGLAADDVGEKVGVYESRAVALAWGRSTQHNEVIKQLVTDAKKAEAAGDEAELRRLRKEGSSRQERLEHQVFGDDRIPDIMARIEGELPAIRRQAGVTRIVDRRDAAKGAVTVDVTTNLLALFHPTDKTLKMIEEIQKQKPLKHIPKH